MARVLVAGCGDLGSEVARLLVLSRHQVMGLRLSQKPLPQGVTAIQGDVTQISTLQPLAHLKPEILIYCVAARAQTDESYQQHYVQGLKNTIVALNDATLKHVFFVSSTRVYGQAQLEGDRPFDEASPVIPADFGGRRLLEAEQYLQALPFSHSILRLSGIYGVNRLRLVNLSGQVAQWPPHNRWTNRIHRDDAARFMVFLIENVVNDKPLANCYIVSDDMPAPQYDVLIWLARQQGIASIQVPPPVHGGKRVSNERLRATGFQLIYPTYQAGYTQVLQHV